MKWYTIPGSISVGMAMWLLLSMVPQEYLLKSLILIIIIIAVSYLLGMDEGSKQNENQN